MIRPSFVARIDDESSTIPVEDKISVKEGKVNDKEALFVRSSSVTLLDDRPPMIPGERQFID